MSYAYNPKPDHKNMIVAMLLAGVLLICWQAFIELPRKQELARAAQEQTKRKAALEVEQAKAVEAQGGDEEASLTREQRLAASPRLAIDSPRLQGSIALQGARFDDLVLKGYRTEVDPHSPDVILLSPRGQDGAYFAETGWVAERQDIRVPGPDTVWKAQAPARLGAGRPVSLSWDNGQGLRFIQTVALDEDYMFTITQRVENTGGQPVELMPYGLVNRAYVEPATHYAILHEGPLGVLDHKLSEIQYKELRDKGKQSVADASGWLGFTDKYWLTALIPAEGGFKANFSYYKTRAQNRYQADYLGQPVSVAPGGSAESSTRLFAGAKETKLLDAYAEGKDGNPPVPLFDRAVDYGVLYFLTKPMMTYLLTPFYHLTGNFGIAIILLTLVIKTLMFPLAYKSYHAMAAMRELQPEMTRLKEAHGSDKVKFNQELITLYKREKVNPASGCLPVVIQMPVFFALYKVLFVTIEMRHAPFFGWIIDLSAPDPSNIFNLFGLLPFTPPAMLHLGLLPILMAITMFIQMQSQPTPADPTQAKVTKFMPWFFMIFAAKFPAGLVLYWVCSNTISVIQQAVISSGYKRKLGKKKIAGAARG